MLKIAQYTLTTAGNYIIYPYYIPRAAHHSIKDLPRDLSLDVVKCNNRRYEGSYNGSTQGLNKSERDFLKKHGVITVREFITWIQDNKNITALKNHSWKCRQFEEALQALANSCKVVVDPTFIPTQITDVRIEFKSKDFDLNDCTEEELNAFDSSVQTLVEEHIDNIIANIEKTILNKKRARTKSQLEELNKKQKELQDKLKELDEQQSEEEEDNE